MIEILKLGQCEGHFNLRHKIVVQIQVNQIVQVLRVDGSNFIVSHCQGFQGVVSSSKQRWDAFQIISTEDEGVQLLVLVKSELINGDNVGVGEVEIPEVPEDQKCSSH